MSEKIPSATPPVPVEDDGDANTTFAESGMFNDRELSVIATVLSAIRAATDGNIEARDKLMRDAVEQYEASQRLH
jgi:hypothetical protein